MHFPDLSCSGSSSWVLHKGTDLVGCVFCVLLRSEQLRQPGAWRAHCPRWTVHLNHLPGPSHSVSQVCHKSTISDVLCISSVSSSQAAALLDDVNHPGSQEDSVSNWEPAHSLAEDAVSGVEIATCLPALAVAHLPLCLWLGEGPLHSRMAFLWHWLNPLFCEWARLHLRLELFMEKFSLSLFFPSLAIP